MVNYSSVISGWFSASSIDQLISMFLWGFLFIGVLAMSVKLIRDKVKYKYHGVVQKRRQVDWMTGQPSSKKVEGKAGYFKSNGRPIFRIKYGWMPWHVIDIKKLPDPNYMQDNTAYFLQYNVGEYTQAKMNIDWDTETIKIEPVDSTTKAAAKQELSDYSFVFAASNKLKENLGIAIMGFLLIAGLIAYYFVNKACTG